MQKPTIRYVVAAVLIAAAVIGGFFVFDAHRRAADIEIAAREVHSRIEQMITAAEDLAAVQRAYVAQGQPQQPWFGYSLGDWDEGKEYEAQLALQGKHYETGEKLKKQRVRP